MEDANKLAVTTLKSLIETSSSNPQIKLIAITALGEAGGAVAVGKLKQLIEAVGSNDEIKRQAIIALGRAGRLH